ncbi:MAG: hypothetical protein IAI49_07365 [Candidatus Eremiobacteraeota bacterium]|nr:hypothetical protein [Candidatus Eremiobacteraeota bacterium]
MSESIVTANVFEIRRAGDRASYGFGWLRTNAEAPVALTQDAAFMVSRLGNASIEYGFDAGRLGFLFVAQGEAGVEVLDTKDRATNAAAVLGEGDALRLANVARVAVSGAAEVVLCDLPRIKDGAND